MLAGGRRFFVIFCRAARRVISFGAASPTTPWVILALFALSLSGIKAAISFNVALVTDLVHRARDVGKAIA